MKEEKNAALILGLIAVVAVIGLVFMFVNNNNATGLVSTYGVPKVQIGQAMQTVRYDSKLMEIPISEKDAETCPRDGVCNVPEADANVIMKTGQFNCFITSEKEKLYTCRATPESQLGVMNIM